jgi:hypothetical protein
LKLGNSTMEQSSTPARLLILDIDGLRQDVYLSSLQKGRLPHLARLLGGPQARDGLHIQAVTTAPSITFCAQTTLFTGLQPGQHGIVGNQFFDRFGQTNHGKPRFYAFDVGDALAVKDAVDVFRGAGSLAHLLSPSQPTLYEMAARHGLASLVAYHMHARGATRWIRPDLLDIARFTKGGGLIGLGAEAYDTSMLDKLLEALQAEPAFQVICAYFMGLDHTSHQLGPESQPDYLERVVDPLVGRLVNALAERHELLGTLVVVVSDHGQIRVIPDDRHSLRLSFPFDLEMGYLFKALGIDVNDKPGEGADCDAIVACNGGLAHVYLRRHGETWPDPPVFTRDVLPIAAAFWEANQAGRYAPDLKGALAAVLVRQVDQAGWLAKYQLYTPGGLLPLETFFGDQTSLETIAAIPRLDALAGPHAGDLLLVANTAAGFYFGSPITGIHGGLHPGESLATLSLAWVGASPEQASHLQQVVSETIQARQVQEHRSDPSLSDLVPILQKLWGWE